MSSSDAPSGPAVEPAKKPAPDVAASQCAPSSFYYEASPSGVDSNLLILLHGLGDNQRPFVNLAKRLQKNVPQTATLVLRGGCAIPFMEGEDAWSYWHVWDSLGQEIPNPDPSSFLQSFRRLIDYLTKPVDQGGCAWPVDSIHLLGFAHGAAAALEGSIAYSRQTKADKPTQRSLGSIVSVCGELLSHPTFSPALDIPVLMFDRSGPKETEKPRQSLQRAFSHVEAASFPGPNGDPTAKMPHAEQEWSAIMQFWAKRIRNRSSWELQGQVYPV